MKLKITHAFLLLTLPFFLFAKSTIRHLEGRWFDERSGLEVKLKTKRNEIKTKGIKGQKWRTFEYLGQQEFIDRSGNVLRVISPSKLVYFDRNERTRVYRRSNFSRKARASRSSTAMNSNSCAVPSRGNRYYVQELDEYIRLEF